MNKTQEIWKKVRNYDVEVSTMGNVRKHSTKEAIVVTNYNETLSITAVKNKLPKKFQLSTLIHRTFIGRIPKGYAVKHWDNNYKHNNVENLHLVFRGIATSVQKSKENKKLKKMMNHKKKYSMKELARATKLHATTVSEYLKKGSAAFPKIGYPTNIIDFDVEVFEKSNNQGRPTTFTSDQIIEIRKDYWLDYKKSSTMRYLAEKHNTSPAVINAIVNERCHKHIKVTPIFEKV